MIGQDAVRTAAEFDRRLALDGFILTKLDGDARGGAALSHQGGHRQAHQVPRHGRGAGQARGVPTGRARQPHPRLRRHRRADEGLRAGRRRGEGRGGRQEAPLRQLLDEGLRRADPHRPEDGPAEGPAREVPHLRRDDRAAEPRREGAREDRGDVRLDDRGGAAPTPRSSTTAASGASPRGSGRKKQEVQELLGKLPDDAAGDGRGRPEPRAARPHPRLQAAGPASQDEEHGPRPRSSARTRR